MDVQTTENQELDLRTVGERTGWEIVEIWPDREVSGSKSRKHRPAFDQLLRDASRRRFDRIACWSVDRLGRSLQDLVGFFLAIHSLRIDLFLHQQGLDTPPPSPGR